MTENGSIDIPPDHYYSFEYNSKSRWTSYWHQINEVLKCDPETVLEVGIGNGFTSTILKRYPISLISVDTDARLHPDMVCTVLNLPFDDNSFDVICCYEVLEHIPIEQFNPALKEIHRCTKEYALISLPDISPKLRVGLQRYNILIPIPHRIEKNKFNGVHYWEIGRDGTLLNNIQENMKKAGFKIKKSYQNPDMPYHRFFVLLKEDV